MLVGRIHDPVLAEAILQRGDADLIAMARPLLADPELPNKVRSGNSASVRRCISCQNCIDSMEIGSMNCAVNGRSGREGESSLAPSATPRRVVVVGGGPGGMEAARLLAQRGHRVSLHERAPYLGGALVTAATVHPENRPFLEFLLRELKNSPVEVTLNAKLDAAAIARLAPDAVVIATGGRVVAPRIPGDDGANVFTGPHLRQILAGRLDPARSERLTPARRAALRSLSGPLARVVRPNTLRALSKVWMPLGRRVAIVGGDLAAIELAEFLATRGRRVSVIDSAPRLAPEIGLKRLSEHMDRLDRLGIAVLTETAAGGIDAGGVRIALSGGGIRRVEADSVIIAGRLEPDTELFEATRALLPATYSVGDCTGLGLIRKAVEEATRVACAL
jgi:2,4-dienoyl-CoA reductase (NADPH2)